MTIVTWMSIKNVVKEIAREVKVLKSDKGHYNIRICKETAAESACDNVDNAVDIGTEQMELTEKTCPVGFYGPISKKVITMDVTRNHVKIGAAKMFNTTLLFSRVIGL